MQLQSIAQTAGFDLEDPHLLLYGAISINQYTSIENVSLPEETADPRYDGAAYDSTGKRTKTKLIMETSDMLSCSESLGKSNHVACRD
jgi:hypothetical protein